MSYSFSVTPQGESYIEELNRNDFINMKSFEFFDRMLDLDLQRENTLYLMVGSDSGLILPYLHSQKIGRGSRVAVIEHDDVFPIVARKYRGLLDPTDKNTKDVEARITLHSHQAWIDEIFDGSDEPWLLAGELKIVESRASAVDYSRIYMPIFRGVNIAAQERVSDLSISLSRKSFVQTQFRNATDNINPLKKSLHFGEGKTAVVLGGGPSLDDHFAWICENSDSLFIIAVSRIAKKLVKNGLKPDIIVTVDPQDISYEISKDALLWTDVPLVYTYHASAKLVQQWQGPTLYLGKRLPWYTNEQTNGFVASVGPTVSHAAAFVAAQLGFTQILLTGVDLCYSASASTHANDSPEQMIQRMPSLCDAQVKTYSGRLAGTCFNLKQAVKALDDIGSFVNKDKPRLFNMNFEAALCISIPFIHVNDIQLTQKKPDFSSHMNVVPGLVPLAKLDALENDLKHARHCLGKIRSLCTKAKTCVAQLHSDDVGQNASKYSLKLKKTRKLLESSFPEYLDAIIYTDAIEFGKTTSPIEFKDMKLEELVSWGQNYYKLIDKGALSMIQLIDESQQRIALRRDEHDSTMSVRLLAKRWREDETPGRVLIWKRSNGQNVKPDDKAWLQRAVGKFRATLNAPTVKAASIFSGHNENIDNVLKSLVFLSDKNCIEELQSIELNLAGDDWPYIALKPFTSGLIFSIQEDPDRALALFQTAIDACSEQLENAAESLQSMQLLIEECLVRMTHCYVQQNNHTAALTTLGMLCEMLPGYIVTYAKMLSTCGETRSAIELLESFVELYPHNKKAAFLLDELRPDGSPAFPEEMGLEYGKKISEVVSAVSGVKPGRAA